MENFVLHGASRFLYDGNRVSLLRYDDVIGRRRNVEPIEAVGLALAAIDAVKHDNIRTESFVVSGAHLNGFGIGGEVYSPREARPLFFGNFACFDDYLMFIGELEHNGFDTNSVITMHSDGTRHIKYGRREGNESKYYEVYSSFGPMNGDEGMARMYLAIADAIKHSDIYEKSYLKKIK